ncbi:ABC-three component system protein [Billgrantia desiderata]|uniref:ABC-three component system protein n=1 Tax=Billgrantia desiderata TaxID=52021 RepID=UPI00089F28C9|nr:ABC-three component system protein [Halomonas desiderata]SEG48754.1 HNH endonuclease [Halomonas desiderata]
MANARVPYHPEEHSILYGETGGACPLCTQPIIFKKAGSKNPSKGYEVAHIYPLNPTPVQAQALIGYPIPDDRNGLDNVICLCPTCHRRFDKDFKIEEYIRIRAIKDRFIRDANARKAIAEHTLRDEVKEILELITSMHIDGAGTFGLEFDAKTLSDKLKTGASTFLKRNIRNDVVDYFVSIRDEMRLLEKRDQASVKMLQNQVNTYFWEMHRQNPDNKDLVYQYIAQWISAKTGKSIDASRILTSFFVQNCEVFDASP